MNSRNILLVISSLLSFSTNLEAQSGASSDDIHERRYANIRSIKNGSIMNDCVYLIENATVFDSGILDTSFIVEKSVAKWSNCPEKVLVGYNKYTKKWRILND